jgi:hypothetical protein
MHRTVTLKRCIAASTLLLVATSIFGRDRPDWLTLSVGEASVEQAIYLYGIPDFVTANLLWADFMQRQAKPRRLEGFSMEYLPLRGKLTVLSGPLGTASTATLDFHNDVLVARTWTYRGPTLSSGMSAWTSDAALQLTRNQMLLVSSKRVGGLLLTVSCPTSGRSLLCVGEINASLSSNGTAE